MSWIVLDRAKLEDEPFLAAGRALLVCQHFESTCKNIVMWFSLADALHKEQFAFLSDAHMNYVDKLLELWLGPSINKLPALLPKSSESEMAALVAAKDSRNSICHDSMQQLAHSWDANSGGLDWDTEHNRHHVRALAHGDYIISRWSYEFHEKQSGAFKQRDAYVSQVVAWVFGELNKAGHGQ